MTLAALQQVLHSDDVGADMHRFIAELYPICRSITGDGVRQTLRLISAHVPLDVREVPSGTAVFDWTVPREWNIRDAYVKDGRGQRVIDFNRSNLHVVSYSTPIKATMTLRELDPHLHSLPDQPDLVPYRTSYYREDWGFCLSHNQRLALRDEEYEVCIEATLADGHLTYGELVLPGERGDEFLISTHVCHPSLCNDNLSGIAVATFLARYLATVRRRYTYRFLFIPGTIGSITWLVTHQAQARNIRHGLVLTGVGDAGGPTYKKSRRGDAEVDRAAALALAHHGGAFAIEEFVPYGYDERQYCSPGFNLPVGCLMRTPHGRYPQYHTSADNLEFVRPAALADSLAICLEVLSIVEQNRTYVTLNPYGEPQLGKRGLYRLMGGGDQAVDQMALLWVLNQSDGLHSLLEIAERSGMRCSALARAAEALVAHDLLREQRDGADVLTSQ